MKTARLAFAVATLALLSAHALAQDYPAKTVRMIVPFPPGGSNDLIARQLATQMSDRLGKQFVIDNRGGAGGIVGTEIVAKSPPDGYNLLIISVAYPMGAAVYTKLPYDPAKSFTPVALLGTGPNVLSVHPSLPVKTLKELLTLAKARPGHLQYASAGVGTFQHLSAELFKSMAKVDIVHVPYKGGGPATIDTLAGQVHMTIGSLIQVLPHFRTGRLRPIATGGAKRASTLPDIPTISEAGVPGYEANNWWGILAPTGTPDAVVRKINSEANAVMTLADTKKRLSAEGVETIATTPEQFGKH
ncbi:MAG TPA: tripartite tricarboxylate transporter substrate binding protein, partial [Burkholderiales bacterium]|nr:tripartite tricarboxylate transporter substrate binding protein [Burkholderiales bacterium]